MKKYVVIIRLITFTLCIQNNRHFWKCYSFQFFFRAVRCGIGFWGKSQLMLCICQKAILQENVTQMRRQKTTNAGLWTNSKQQKLYNFCNLKLTEKASLSRLQDLAATHERTLSCTHSVKDSHHSSLDHKVLLLLSRDKHSFSSGVFTTSYKIWVSS